jgi:hypothetical protein
VNRSLMFTAATLLLIGCSSASSGPALIGRDTYFLAGSSMWGSDVQADLYREADSFCREQGRQIKVIYASGRNPAASLYFRCLSQGRPLFEDIKKNPMA